MLKWVQALMGETPLPEELRTSLTEKSVLRAIENQKKIIEEMESKTWRWDDAGVLRLQGNSLVFVDPHWYRSDFDPYLDEPYWVMTEMEAPADTVTVQVMTAGEKGGDRSLGRVRLLFDEAGLEAAGREHAGMVDLECYNIVMVSSRDGISENWKTGGSLNQCLLEVEQRSRRQFTRDHQLALDLLNRAGYSLKPLSHGYAHEFDRPLYPKDLDRARDLLIEADIPARITCTSAQTFAEIEHAMRGELYAALPDKSDAWTFAFDVPSDGIIFALVDGERVIGYEIDFIAGLREVFERQRDLIYRGLGKFFKQD